MIKGGVWKNTEDEILKAAVMKYGKNQWARISSLLVRKSAKQCKARWFEWLDPSIKKTEWTREEDEKLLHLAKLMPTQWRTIAPIVGRTPSQCLERYEKLLDAAVSKDEEYDPMDDPRRLRPGEIDPNPEAKPARPDAIDMDEDEKEMLSEARARLANTKGKKAKRKAREKRLDEARRLASIQKNREMRAAGMGGRNTKRIVGIDYNAEIAFEKLAPKGPYDVSEEKQMERKMIQDAKFKSKTIHELDGKMIKEREEEMRTMDKLDEIAKKKNVPKAVKESNKQLDNFSAGRIRGKLNLPKPSVSESELERIAKLRKMGFAPDTTGITTSNQLPGQETPMIQRKSRDEMVLEEARYLAAMTATKSTLYGGETPSGFADGAGKDFAGATPSIHGGQRTNQRGHTNVVHGTPALQRPGTGIVGQTPLRDNLHINDPDAMAEFMRPSDSAGSNQQAAPRRPIASGIKSRFASLPKPKNEFKVQIPNIDELDELEDVDAMEVDASGHRRAPFEIEEDEAERRVRLREREEKARHEMEKRRSQVYQRRNELPKPNVSKEYPTVVAETRRNLDETQKLIDDEMIELIKRDLNGIRPEDDPNFYCFSSEQLAEAKAMLAAEAGDMPDSFAEQFHKAREQIRESARGKDVGSKKAEYQALYALMGTEAKKASKLERKVALLHEGYRTRSVALSKKLKTLHDEFMDKKNTLRAFELLEAKESLGAPIRVEKAMELAGAAREKEMALQEKYATAISAMKK